MASSIRRKWFIALSEPLLHSCATGNTAGSPINPFREASVNCETHNSISHYNTPDCIVTVWILSKNVNVQFSSPRTVRVTRTSTEPNRFRATHSYSAVSSFWALLNRREPLFSMVMRSLPNSGRPWRVHSITGTGSPSAWQFSITVEPASTTVSTGSTVIVGEPVEEHWCYYSKSPCTRSPKYSHAFFRILHHSYQSACYGCENAENRTWSKFFWGRTNVSEAVCKCDWHKVRSYLFFNVPKFRTLCAMTLTPANTVLRFFYYPFDYSLWLWLQTTNFNG